MCEKSFRIIPVSFGPIQAILPNNTNTFALLSFLTAGLLHYVMLCTASFSFPSAISRLTPSIIFASFSSHSSSGLGIDIPPDPLAVGTSGRVFAHPEVVVQLIGAAGAGFAVFGFVGFEATLVGVGLHLPSIPDAVQE